MERSAGMINYTNGLKNNTLKKVKDAIDTLRDRGQPIKRKEILALSGLSSSVLSKPYVKELLKQEKVLMYEESEKNSIPLHSISLQEHNKQLEKEVEKLNNMLTDKEISIEYLKEKNNKLSNQLDDKELEIQRLRGKLQNLLEFINRIGITDELEEVLFDELFKY